MKAEEEAEERKEEGCLPESSPQFLASFRQNAHNRDRRHCT